MRYLDVATRCQPVAVRTIAALAVVLALLCPPGADAAAADDDVDIALSLATLLRSSRTVISVNQDRINNPAIGDKGLSGDAVMAMAIKDNLSVTGRDPQAVDPTSPKGQLLAALTDAIKEVMTANQETINQPGVGFKGFVPAVFGRLVAEQFRVEAGSRANIKVTAPPELVRNRKAAPDAFETQIIRTKFRSPDWPRGQFYAQRVTEANRPVTRVLVPEYYGADCLECHGKPKGAIDITGYPKEGADLNDLGGVISISLFH